MRSDLMEFVIGQRVARMASVDTNGRPHVVPICFVLDGTSVIYSAIDLKPKSVETKNLRRVRNIANNPSVSILLDRYTEDWAQLGFVILHGAAKVLAQGTERNRAEDLLRKKYSQYEKLLQPGAPMIKINVGRITSWGNLTGVSD